MADEAHKLALCDIELDVTQRRKQAFGGLEGLLDILDFNELGAERYT